MQCTACKREFTPRKSNQIYCSASCRKSRRRKADSIFGGGIKRKGKSIEVRGAMNCIEFMRGML